MVNNTIDMHKVSRTHKSLRNAKISLIFYVFNLIISFVSRKYFLKYLGAEILGLNTTIGNVLEFLNIAELGIASAVAFCLYKPVYEKDKEAINEIISVQGYFYKRIGFFVIAAAIVLLCFFPLIFAKAEVEPYYPYITFIVFFIGVILTYFISYKQIILISDQKDYKKTTLLQSIKFVKVIFQIIILILTHSFILWLAIELVMSVLSVYLLNKTIYKEYPWLKLNTSEGKRLMNKYPDITRKTKQVFFHKISYFVLNQTSPLIIYSFLSLTIVGLYSNYLLIIGGISLLVGVAFNSIEAGIGNLIAEGNKKKNISVFWEIFIARFWLASIICFGTLTLTEPFITIWIGKEYILPQTTLIILVASMSIRLIRTTVDNFLSGHGLFNDVWAPITELVLNLGLSVILGYYWGLNGILAGVLISQTLIIGIWKPIFLFNKGLEEPTFKYFIHLFFNILIVGIIGLISYKIMQHINFVPDGGYFKLLFYCLISMSIFTVLYTISLLIISSHFQIFLKRIYSQLVR